MALATTLSSVTLRAPAGAVRASVASGSRAPANLNLTVQNTPKQLMSRLDALRLKAKNFDLPQALAVAVPVEGAEEVLTYSHFSEHRLRLQHWWKEHLEDKAALVQAAAPSFAACAEETEQSVHLEHPVEIDWVRDRYPTRNDMSRF